MIDPNLIITLAQLASTTLITIFAIIFNRKNPTHKANDLRDDKDSVNKIIHKEDI